MRCSMLRLLGVATLLASGLHAADVDTARLKAAVAAFLGVPATSVRWPPVANPSEPLTWYDPIAMELPDPPGSNSSDRSRTIFVRVHPRDYYVQGVSWRANMPPETPKCANQLPVEGCQPIAERFARSKVRPWPKNMRMAFQGISTTGPPNPLIAFVWEAWDGPARTGTRVTVTVNPCPPGRVYSFSQYVAPRHEVGSVKVSQDQAAGTACDLLKQRGAVNPRLKTADLYLSEPQLERPHWKITLEYDNRNGGFLPTVFVDAVTGAVLEPSR